MCLTLPPDRTQPAAPIAPAYPPLPPPHCRVTSTPINIHTPGRFTWQNHSHQVPSRSRILIPREEGGTGRGVPPLRIQASNGWSEGGGLYWVTLVRVMFTTRETCAHNKIVVLCACTKHISSMRQSGLISNCCVQCQNTNRSHRHQALSRVYPTRFLAPVSKIQDQSLN